VRIQTTDDLQLGAWQLLPTPYFRQLRETRDSAIFDNASVYTQALQEHDTVIYFHGNGGNRALSHRLETYQVLYEGLSANVVTFDYRGFADSEGVPSEEGLVRDARAVWDWTVAQGADPARIALLGHSLGSGVATRLALELQKQGFPPQALILQAPYTSIPELVFDFRPIEWFPMPAPLSPLRVFQELAWGVLETHLDTKTHIKSLTCPVLILHGKTDLQIPAQHSRILFDSLVSARNDAPETVRESVKAREYAKIATSDGQVTYVEFLYASHNDIQRVDAVVEVIREFISGNDEKAN